MGCHTFHWKEIQKWVLEQNSLMMWALMWLRFASWTWIKQTISQKFTHTNSLSLIKAHSHPSSLFLFLNFLIYNHTQSIVHTIFTLSLLHTHTQTNTHTHTHTHTHKQTNTTYFSSTVPFSFSCSLSFLSNAFYDISFPTIHRGFNKY